MNKAPKPSANTLPCLFATLTEKYADKQLKPCETKSEQHIRRASGDKVQCENKENQNGILHQEKNQLKEQNFWLSIFLNYFH